MPSFERYTSPLDAFPNIGQLLKDECVDREKLDSVTLTLLECADRALDYSRNQSEWDRGILVTKMLIGRPPEDSVKVGLSLDGNLSDISEFTKRNRDPDLSGKMTRKLNGSAGVGLFTRRVDQLLSIDKRNAPWIRCDVIRCSSVDFGKRFGLVGGAYCRSEEETGRLILPSDASDLTTLHEYTHAVADNFYFANHWLGVGFNEGMTEWISNERRRSSVYRSQTDFVHSLFVRFPDIKTFFLKGYRSFKYQSAAFSLLSNRLGPQLVTNLLLMDTGDPTRTIPFGLKPHILPARTIAELAGIKGDWRVGSL